MRQTRLYDKNRHLGKNPANSKLEITRLPRENNIEMKSIQHLPGCVHGNRDEGLSLRG